MSDHIDPRRDLVRAELARVDGVDPLQGPPNSKHVKMLTNPLRFLRGSAQLYYADLRSGVLCLPESLIEQVPITSVMGDCHVSNFGFITEGGSYGEDVVFCPNDYDDACMGPAVWDLARFAISLLLAAEYCEGVLAGRYRFDEVDDLKGLKAVSADDARAAGEAFLAAYRKGCRRLAADPGRRRRALDDFDKRHVLGKPLRKARRRSADGEDFQTKSTLAKAVEHTRTGLRFRTDPERFQRVGADREEQIRYTFRPYVDDSIIDLVRRIDAGTGSVDLQRYYLLVGPRECRVPRDLPLCHLVEVKQQRPASAIYHFPALSPVNRLDPAHLTLDCQRRMQRRADLVLDEAVWEYRQWLIRSRHHARVGMDPEDIGLAKRKPGKRLVEYAEACGEALSLAHSRGDRRSTRFEAAMAEVLGDTADTLLDAAWAYADVVRADYGRLRAMLVGRLSVRS